MAETYQIGKGICIKTDTGKRGVYNYQFLFQGTYIIRINETSPDFKIREELRKTAFNLRKQIKSNNHSELVIASYQRHDRSC